MAAIASSTSMLRKNEEGAGAAPESDLTGMLRSFSIGLRYSSTWLKRMRLPETARPRLLISEVPVSRTMRDCPLSETAPTRKLPVRSCSERRRLLSPEANFFS